MRYYILRAQGENDIKAAKERTSYSFNIKNINAERFLSDINDKNVSYLLYNVKSKKFIEEGLITNISCDDTLNNFEVKLSPKNHLDIDYLPYSSPNCRIIPATQSKVEEILNLAC